MVRCSYFNIKGLIIQNIKEYGQAVGSPIAGGIELTDCTNMKHIQMLVQGCGDGFEASGSCDYLKYKNCDAYNNYSYCDNGDFANGFTLTMYGSTIQAHIELDGCRSWYNSDDGFDLFASDGSYQGGYVTFNNCWSFNNGRGSAGNGAGFKWGHTYIPRLNSVQRIFTNCITFNNNGIGYDKSESAVSAHFYNNVAYHNGLGTLGGQGFFNNNSDGTENDDGVPSIFENNISYNNTGGDYFLVSQIRDHDSWTIGYTVTDNDFLSVDPTGTDGPRNPDGSLPTLSFLKLKAGSGLIGAGINVGLATDGAGNFYNSSPSIGAYEYVAK